MSRPKPTKCTDCKVAIGGQHNPGCHRQGIVTEASDYTYDLPLKRPSWMDDPKAVEAVEYLLSIGMNSDEFAQADAEESGG